MAERRTILIAGAGIAGLTAALTLAKTGFRIIVCERASELSELGAGIQISPNAGRILAALGLDEAIAREAVEPQAIDIHGGESGRRITSIAAREFRERYGVPYRAIHRADLQAVLATAVIARPDITVRLGSTISGLIAQASGHLAKIKHGSESDVVAAAAIIGADGVWSELRRRIPGAGAPKPTGRSAWRALVPADNAPASLPTDRVGLWLGQSAHLVTYPVARGSAINIVAIVEEEWTRPGWSAAGDGEWLAARFASWSAAAREVIAAPFSWQKWAIVALDASGPWVEGPIALIGDSAHAMTPFVAQGAAMAVEDAAVLARCLSRGSDIAAGLRAYEAARKPRVLAVASAAARTGDVYHWHRPRALARDLGLRFLGSRLVFWQNDWIYRWEPT